MDKSLAELKDQGNQHFKVGDFKLAEKFYSDALDKADKKQDKLIFYKNRAACHLKLENWMEAVTDATNALNISSSDTKALFRRVQALEELGQIDKAYNDARRLYQMDGKNKAVEQIVTRLRKACEIKLFEERSTNNRVKSMLKIMFDQQHCDEDKRSKACNNLLVLALEEEGAEEIFREAGPETLATMLDNHKKDIRVNILRVLTALCKGHAARSLVILRTVTIQKLCEIMGHKSTDEEDKDEELNENLSNGVFNLLQSIVNALQGDETKELKHGQNDLVADYAKDLFEVMITLRDMLIDPTMSCDGRDNCIALVAKNIPREDVRVGTNSRTMKFIEVGGVKAILDVASYGYKITQSPFPLSANTRLNCSVALSKLYDDLLADKYRDIWNEHVQSYIQNLFGMQQSICNMRAMSVITCLLQGPYDCGQAMIGLKGVLETMVAMTATEEEESQISAVEAIISSTSKHSKASFVVQNGTNLLKTLYKTTKSDAVKVRTLVGLCKLGSSHGADVSLRPFADGSTVKLAKHCKKYMCMESTSFESKKWAAEGLSFLTLDADVKEDLCRDPRALKALFELCKTKDKTVIYGIASTLVNCTNTYEKKEEITPEMIDLAKYSKQHIPEEHPKDKKECAMERLQLLVEANMIPALVQLAITDTSIQSDTSKELLCRLLCAVTEVEGNRGAVVAAGGGKALLPLAQEGTKQGKRIASHALARIAINADPRIVFPGQKSLECVRVLKQLLHPECEAIETYETLLALTNLASIDDHHRRRIIREQMICDIESYMLEEHLHLRRSATELMCNMCMSEEFIGIMEQEGHDRIKLMTLLLAEEDDKTRIAASGSLAMCTNHSEKICKKIRGCCASWLENLSMLIVEEKPDICFRGLIIIRNICDACKFTSEDIVKSEMFEVVMARSRDGNPANQKLRMASLEVLEILAKHKFIQPTGL